MNFLKRNYYVQSAILGHKYSMGNITLNICKLRKNPERCMIKYYSEHVGGRTHMRLCVCVGGGSTKLANTLTKDIFAALGPHLITWGSASLSGLPFLSS